MEILTGWEIFEDDVAEEIASVACETKDALQKLALTFEGTLLHDVTAQQVWHKLLTQM